MQPSNEMTAVIDKIGDKHGYTWGLAGPGTKLKVELELGDTKFYPLVIEVMTNTTLRVAHEITDEGTGQVVYNPEVFFFTGFHGGWIAMELRQGDSLITRLGLPERKQISVELTDGGRYVKNYDPTGQKNIAIFVKAWAKQLKAAGWHDLSTDATYHQTTFNERGEVEQIVREMAEQNRRDGITMTVSSGNKSVTLMGKH